MTLGVMSLVSLEAPQGDQSSQAKASTPKSVEDALVLLRALRPEIQRVLGGAGMISLPLTGLHIMNGNREEAHVMYTGPGDAVDDSPMWKACCTLMQMLDRFFLWVFRGLSYSLMVVQCLSRTASKRRVSSRTTDL